MLLIIVTNNQAFFFLLFFFFVVVVLQKPMLAIITFWFIGGSQDMLRCGGLVVSSVGLRSKRSGVRSSLRSPCCILEQDTFTSPKGTGNTQEAVAPSLHD